MKYIKKLDLSDEVFTKKEKRQLEKAYEKGNDYYNQTTKK